VLAEAPDLTLNELCERYGLYIAARGNCQP
jgi:hypothetical protein